MAGLRAARQRSGRDDTWSGRVALITGGATGLGLAMARELAADGVSVWLVARNEERVARAVSTLRAEGADAHGHVADVTDPEAVAGAVEAVTAHHGRLDILVNNAGVITAMPFANAELSDFAASMNVHFWGPLHMVRAALPWLRGAKPGHILNISSIGGKTAVPHLAPCCAGKFALTGLSQVLHAELAADDIRVTTATPGLMRTGSIGRVRVRGQHGPEAAWFAAAGTNPLLAMDGQAAAREIVAALKQGRAVVTPGWPARLEQSAEHLAPRVRRRRQGVREPAHPAGAGDEPDARAVDRVGRPAVAGRTSGRGDAVGAPCGAALSEKATRRQRVRTTQRPLAPAHKFGPKFANMSP